MSKITFKTFAAVIATTTWLAAGAFAQGTEAAPPADAAAPAEAAAAEAVPAEPSAPAFSQDQLDQMLAPIALYPDSLLTQLMMASTYPLEIVEAARWREKNAALEGDALDKALEPEDWDPSVKAIAIFPDIVSKMSDNLDWTQDLGDAFLGQQKQVLDTIQALRKQAYDAGNLKTSEQQTVTVESPAAGTTQIIQIEPAATETVYVPQYNSAAVYGEAPPAQPYYPQANTYTGTDMLMTGALSFGAGLLVGNLIWDDDSDCDWDDGYAYHGGGYGGHNDVDINVDGDVNIGNRTNIKGGDRQKWQHNPTHRGGVKYRDNATRQTYANRPGARPSLDRASATGYSRNTLGSGGGHGKVAAAGSRTGSGVGSKGPAPKIGGGVPSKSGSKVGGGVQGKSAPKVATAKKAAPVQKRPTSGIGSAGGHKSTAVGGLGGGSATRAASARGASSRGKSSLGGGGSRGGGGLGGASRGGGGGGGKSGGGKRR